MEKKTEEEKPEYVQRFLDQSFNCAHCGRRAAEFSPNGRNGRTIKIHCRSCAAYERGLINIGRKKTAPHNGISFALVDQEDRKAINWILKNKVSQEINPTHKNKVSA